MLKDRILDLKYEMLCARTARRQEAAKAALVRRGVVPRVRISGAYVPPCVARVYTYTNVRGLA
ncbi:hypothetical protein [Paraburkholderia rhynchosiae]|uniref:Uncharacterized protein n=1 Tax=Paraburkholderia rhynchosiae TaxID=487049 RepID=A0A2N7W992_9BURK|nr:hypothetical protein [Paraburkholderia rhynchosiae]PMS25964.1 hypothetical protein C0Z16_27915 [Paraburkholderia rhynchosiae]CAB3730546.1 hypothetical protein LMG27174_05755 [Paraburkholderia rhynchosiae]